jgi:hypothetical protein
VIKLSEHFFLEELTRSEYASRHGLANAPGLEVVARLTILAETTLEQVRLRVGSPIVPSSGYRSPAVNMGIGGAPTSQHILGEAADFIIPGRSNLEICAAIVREGEGIPFDQLIYEFGETGWIHVSHSTSRSQRRETWKCEWIGKKKVYTPTKF